jgi:phosphate acetyltransferase
MSVMPAEASAKQPGSKYDRLIAAAKSVPMVATVVVHPCDESSLRGAIESAEAGLIAAPEENAHGTGIGLQWIAMAFHL